MKKIVTGKVPDIAGTFHKLLSEGQISLTGIKYKSGRTDRDIWTGKIFHTEGEGNKSLAYGAVPDHIYSRMSRYEQYTYDGKTSYVCYLSDDSEYYGIIEDLVNTGIIEPVYKESFTYVKELYEKLESANHFAYRQAKNKVIEQIQNSTGSIIPVENARRIFTDCQNKDDWYEIVLHRYEPSMLINIDRCVVEHGTLSIKVPEKYMGSFIGKGGSNIKKILSDLQQSLEGLKRINAVPVPEEELQIKMDTDAYKRLYLKK